MGRGRSGSSRGMAIAASNPRSSQMPIDRPRTRANQQGEPGAPKAAGSPDRSRGHVFGRYPPGVSASRLASRGENRSELPLELMGGVMDQHQTGITERVGVEGKPFSNSVLGEPHIVRRPLLRVFRSHGESMNLRPDQRLANGRRAGALEFLGMQGGELPSKDASDESIEVSAFHTTEPSASSEGLVGDLATLAKEPLGLSRKSQDSGRGDRQSANLTPSMLEVVAGGPREATTVGRPPQGLGRGEPRRRAFDPRRGERRKRFRSKSFGFSE